MRSFLSVLLATLVLSACDFGADGPRDLPAVDAEAGMRVATVDSLADARAIWDAAQIDDYEVRYERYCFCGGGGLFQYRVEDGVIEEVWIDGEPTPEDPAIEVLSVDALFERAARAFADEDQVSVRVIPSPPFLVGISVPGQPDVADGGYGYAITGFKAR